MTPSQPTQPQPEKFVPFTARLMAAMRAKETKRPERLFNDPFATQLAGEKASSFVEEKLEARDYAYVIVRTRLFDDFLLSATTKAHQVVILASGMDTRAYRLTWPSRTQVYELDQPQVLKTKTITLQGIAPNCLHHTISTDLTQSWSHLLLEQGYQPQLPSVWLLEGLLMYLSESEVHQLLATISQLTATGSDLGLDVMSVKAGTQTEHEVYKDYFRSGFDDPEELLSQYGWEAEVILPGEEGAHFNRFTEPLPPRDVPDVARAFLVKAKKK